MNSVAIRNKMTRGDITCKTVADKMEVSRATVQRWLINGSPAYRDTMLKSVLASSKARKRKNGVTRRYRPRDGVWKPRAGDMTTSQLEMLEKIENDGTYELVCYANVGSIPVLNALISKGLVMKYELYYELTGRGETLLASGETNVQKLSESIKTELELSGIDPMMGAI